MAYVLVNCGPKELEMQGSINVQLVHQGVGISRLELRITNAYGAKCVIGFDYEETREVLRLGRDDLSEEALRNLFRRH